MTDLTRPFIQKRIKELGLNFAEVSRRLDMNETYVQQYLKKGHPVVLPERIRYALAEILKVSEEELRGNSAPLPTKKHVRSVSDSSSSVDHHSKEPLTKGSAQGMFTSTELFGTHDLPIHKTVHGAGMELHINKSAFFHDTRPPMLLRVADAYGAIVEGETMSPALPTGSTALVNPHLAARVGDRCLFRAEMEGPLDKVLFAEFRGETETTWKVRQLTPLRDFSIKKSDWPNRHKIVGTYFP